MQQYREGYCPFLPRNAWLMQVVTAATATAANPHLNRQCQSNLLDDAMPAI